ncbi:MAG: phosphorylase [Pseudomonadota bacterium]
MATLGIICGLQSEAEALGPLRDHRRVRVGITAGRPDRAERAALRCLSEGCVVLMSWGIAAGLDPALPAGEAVVPAAVAGPDGHIHPMARRLFENGYGEDGPLALGVETPVMRGTDKQALHAAHGALIADMESHRVAAVGASSGVATVTVRVIADTAETDLPPYVAEAIDGGGWPRYGTVLGGLARRPASLPALMRLRRESNAAHAQLRRIAESGFLFPLLA